MEKKRVVRKKERAAKKWKRRLRERNAKLPTGTSARRLNDNPKVDRWGEKRKIKEKEERGETRKKERLQKREEILS